MLAGARSIPKQWRSAGESPASIRVAVAWPLLLLLGCSRRKTPRFLTGNTAKQLDALDAKQVAEDLGPDAILLCWESFNVRCHRRLVAEWLEEKLGIVVPEMDHERAESIPFSERPSKWDAQRPAGAQLPMLF